jgi:isopenicillin N synthase-like dioxygenase
MSPAIISRPWVKLAARQEQAYTHRSSANRERSMRSFRQHAVKDNGFMTVHDRVGAHRLPGLARRLQSGEWSPPPHGRILVNIGNIMRCWLNDRFLSTLVINETDRPLFGRLLPMPAEPRAC